MYYFDKNKLYRSNDIYYLKKSYESKPVASASRSNFLKKWTRYSESTPNARFLRKVHFRSLLFYNHFSYFITITDKNKNKDVNSFVKKVQRFLKDNGIIYQGVIEKQTFFHFHLLVKSFPFEIKPFKRHNLENGEYTTRTIKSSLELEKFGKSSISVIDNYNIINYIFKDIFKGSALPIYSRKLKRCIELDTSDIYIPTAEFDGKKLFPSELFKDIDFTE